MRRGNGWLWKAECQEKFAKKRATLAGGRAATAATSRAPALQYFYAHVTENKFLHTLSLHTQTQSHLALASSPMSKV